MSNLPSRTTVVAILLGVTFQFAWLLTSYRLFRNSILTSTASEWLWLGSSLLVMLLVTVGIISWLQSRLPRRIHLISDDNRLRLLTENISDVIAEHDADGNLQYITANCATVMGYMPDELYDICFRDLVPPESKTILDDVEARIKKNPGSFITYQFQMRHKQGHMIWLEETVRAVVNPDTGKIQSIVTLTRDITERKQIEDQLRESEENYRLLADHISDIVSIHNAEGKIVYMSPSVKTMLGYNPEDLISLDALEFIHEQCKPAVYATVYAVFENPNQPFSIKYRFKHQQGHWVWCESHGSGIVGSDGKLQFIVWGTRDITERKRIEDQLRESEERYRLLAENMSDIITLQAPDGTLIYTSPSVKQMLGYTPQELANMERKEYVHEVHHQQLDDNLIQLKEHPDQPILFVHRVRHADGKWVWFETIGEAIVDENDELQSIISVSRDITERKRAEDLLKRNQLHLNLLAERATDLLVIYSKDGVFNYVSPSVHHILGYQEEDLQGIPAFEFLHEDDLKIWKRTFLEDFGLINQAARREELRFRHKDGHYVRFESHSYNITEDKQKGVTGVAAILRDITDRHQMEQDLRRSQQRLDSLINSPHDSIFLLDVNGIVLETNRRAAQRLKHTREELIGQTIFDLLSSNARQHYLEFRDKLVRDRKTLYQDVPLDGRWFSITAHPVFDEAGTTLALAFIERDITDRRRMEDELRRSEGRLRFIMDHVYDAIFLLDPHNSTYRFLSSGCERILGYRASELIGRSSESLIHPDDLPAIREHYVELSENGQTTFMFQHRFYHKRGDYIWLETRSTNIYNADGEIESIVAISRDITAQKQEIDKLAESEALFRMLTEYNTDLIGRLAPNGRVTYISPQIKTILGYEEAEVIGTNKLFDVLHPDDYELAMQNFARMIDDPSNPLPMSQYRLQHKEGHYVWFEGAGRAVLEPETSKISYVVNINRDITQRKAQIDALIESAARFRMLAEYANDMVALHNEEGEYIYVSPSCKLLLGYEQAELIGLNYKDLIHADDLDSYNSNAYFKILEDSTIITKEDYRYKHKDGHFVWIETTVRLSINHQLIGNGVRVSISRSVASHKQTEVQLQDMLSRERELSELKLQFIETVANEFHTPLATILSSSDMLHDQLETLQSEHTRNQIQKIAHQTQYMREIMDGVLLVAQAEVRRLKSAWDQVEVVSIARACFDEVYARHGIHHQANFESQWNKLTIYSDEHLLRQIIIHLLDNAFKYTPPQGSIQLRLHEEKPDLVITIADRGIGIPEEEQERLFQPFMRGSNNTDVSSIGLGLSIVQRCVTAMDGRVEVTSKVGEGTRFCIFLPLALPDSDLPQ